VEGFVHPDQVRREWVAHRKGNNNRSKLWTIIMFESWLDAQANAAVPSRAARALAS